VPPGKSTLATPLSLRAVAAPDSLLAAGA